MKKTILVGLLAVGALGVNAQRQVGHAKMMQPLTSGFDREPDTLQSPIWDDPNTSAVIYGVVAPPEGPGGYILGTNGYGDLSKAQGFLAESATVVTEVLYWFGAKSDASGDPTSHFKARIYAMDGTGTTTFSEPNGYTSAPGTVLGEVEVPPSLVEYDPEGAQMLTSVMFDPPVEVSDEFGVGIYVASLAALDTVALVSTEDGQVALAEFLWEQWDNSAWYTLPAAGWGGGTFDIEAFILVVVDPTLLGVGDAGMMNNLRMSFLNGNISHGGTVLLGYDVVEAGNMTLVVHNAKGQVMAEQALGAQGVGTYNASFNTSGWADGHYYVTLKNDGRPFTKKMVVQK